MSQVRRVLSRLLEGFATQRSGVPASYRMSEEVVAILMTDEDAEAIRSFLAGEASVPGLEQ